MSNHEDSFSEILELRRRLKMMERLMGEQGNEIDQFNQYLAYVFKEQANDDNDGVPIEIVDQPWYCHSCGSMLGRHNPSNDVTRYRYKDYIGYVKLGAGGVMGSICKKCGELNTINDVRPDPDTGVVGSAELLINKVIREVILDDD